MKMDEFMQTQKNALGINNFLQNAQNYTKENFPDLDMENLFSSAITGNLGTNFWTNTILNFAGNEIKIAIQLMITVLVVIIIHSIFKAIVENLGNDSTSKIIYFIQYLIIVTLITDSFISVMNLTRDTISEITNFMNLLIPLLSTLMLTTGAITTTGMIQPVLLFMISFIGNFISVFLIPMLLISITLGIVSNISDKIQISKLSKFLNSSIVWILGIILTIFVCSVSIEGTLSSSVDGMTAKTAKAAVSNFIPVVGKILGDSVDSIIGCGNILKNAVGVIGVIVILGIVILPILKLAVLWISFHVLSGVCEVVADEKIVKLIGQISDGYKVMLAILFSVSVMFMIGITLVLKITNSALMYR